jgi:hypothetical protein
MRHSFAAAAAGPATGLLEVHPGHASASIHTAAVAGDVTAIAHYSGSSSSSATPRDATGADCTIDVVVCP